MVEYNIENNEFNQGLFDRIINEWSQHSIAACIVEDKQLVIFGEEIPCALSTSIIVTIPDFLNKSLLEHKDKLGHSVDESGKSQFALGIQKLEEFYSDDGEKLNPKSYALLKYYILIANWAGCKNIIMTYEQ